MSHDEEAGTGAGKADRHLRHALDEAAPDQELRAIVTVKGVAASSAQTAGAVSPSQPDDPATPHPRDFPDRVAYRQAMIDHHGKNPRARVGAAKEALERLGLTTRGEGHSGLLIVQGPAGRMADALELEAVERVALDRDVGPRDSEDPPQEDCEPDAEGQDALGLPPGDRGADS